jgi:hypothetical protein
LYQDAREDSDPASNNPPSALGFPPHVFAHSQHHFTLDH